MKFSSQTLRTFTTLHTWVGLVPASACSWPSTRVR
jgi:hypothetical protein